MVRTVSLSKCLSLLSLVVSFDCYIFVVGVTAKHSNLGFFGLFSFVFF